MNSLLEFICDFLFWISNKIIGFTFIVTLIFGVLLGIETYFNFFRISPFQMKMWTKRLGVFFVVFMAIGIFLLILGSIFSPNHY